MVVIDLPDSAGGSGSWVRPRRLRRGARVALIAPAGPLPEGAVERGCERVRELGWEPIVGARARYRRGYLAGTDEDRLADLNAALAAGANDGIWCLRGGYGTMRIVPRIDLGPLLEDPRPLIGFSDNTVLHLAAHRAGIVSFHGPHAGVMEFPEFARDCLRHVLEDPEGAGLLPLPDRGAGAPPLALVPGIAEGRLLGGNLSLLAATMGTPYQVQPAGCILFLEEIGESAYRLDRLLTQLLLAGALDGVRGVMIGKVSDCPDEGPTMPSPAEVIRERLAHLNVPIGFGFPFGHVPHNWTLPVGVQARLDTAAGTLELLEGAVAA